MILHVQVSRKCHEFFNPAKVGQKKKPSIPKKLRSKAPTPTLPSAQRNKSILAESIFRVDITIIEIRPQEEFSTLFAMLLHIATEAHRQCRTDEI